MHKVEFTLQAEEDLSRIDKTIAKRIVEKIEWFCQNTEHIIKEPLTGKLDSFS